MDATTDDIPMDLVRRYDDIEFQIAYDGNCYSILDTSIPMTIADGFFAWVDGIFFLEKESKLI